MTDSQLRNDNERRVARMNVWIDSAEEGPDDNEHAHIRFLLYWIAYEAAYQTEANGKRDDFHAKLARHDRGRLRDILSANRKDVLDILALRQASPSFWKQQPEDAAVSTADAWERKFKERVRYATEKLEAAITKWSYAGANDRIKGTLNTLFKNLNIVRIQIVHGGNAGPQSYGRTQVLLGTRLLTALVPCFRDSIASNPDANWGRPPFPRVGTGPDDACPPPWLELRTRSKP